MKPRRLRIIQKDICLPVSACLNEIGKNNLELKYGRSLIWLLPFCSEERPRKLTEEPVEKETQKGGYCRIIYHASQQSAAENNPAKDQREDFATEPLG